MKAWILDDVGEMNLKEVDKPKLSFGDVQVKVKCAGICGSDIARTYVSGAHKMPLIIGHEFAGEVVCAPGPKSHWLGKRVGVFPLIPCMECEPCKNRKYEMCRNYSYLGSRCDGGFAQYVNVPGINLIELPENVSYEAAAMLEPMAVAAHAYRQVNPKEGDRIVVAGLGTIGLLLTMIILGEHNADNIYVIANKEFQITKAKELGIDESHICDSRKCDMTGWVMQMLSNGPEVFFEVVGKEETYRTAISVTAPGGKVMLVGNPASDMGLTKSEYWKILRNQLTVMGTWNSSFTRGEDDDWHYVLKLLEDGTIKPEELITHRLAMDKLDKGLEMMRDKTEDYIKVMINIEDEESGNEN